MIKWRCKQTLYQERPGEDKRPRFIEGKEYQEEYREIQDTNKEDNEVCLINEQRERHWVSKGFWLDYFEFLGEVQEVKVVTETYPDGHKEDYEVFEPQKPVKQRKWKCLKSFPEIRAEGEDWDFLAGGEYLEVDYCKRPTSLTLVDEQGRDHKLSQYKLPYFKRVEKQMFLVEITSPGPSHLKRYRLVYAYDENDAVELVTEKLGLKDKLVNILVTPIIK